MSAHRDIEAVAILSIQIHKISEVLAEAFAKVKFITEDYLKAAPKEIKEKSTAKKEKSGPSSEQHPQANSQKDEKSHKKEKETKVNTSQSEKPQEKSQDKSKESKKEQKKNKEDKKEPHSERPKKPLTPFFQIQSGKHGKGQGRIS